MSDRPKKIINGVLQYESASGAQLAIDCARAYFYRYVLRKKGPEKKSAARGKSIHKEVEHYLKTGEEVLGDYARQLKPWIPEPGSKLLVEHHLEGFEIVPGLPALGMIDLLDLRWKHLNHAGELMPDPIGTSEVKDWKSTGNLEWAKSGSELPKTIQMSLYGRYALERVGGDFVRLTHVYTCTGKKGSKFSSIRVPADKIVSNFEAIVQPAARLVLDITKETDVNKVEANTNSCTNFGGCDHRSYCQAGQQKTLASIFGERGAMGLLDRLNKTTEEPQKTLSLTEQMNALKAEEAKAVLPVGVKGACEWIKGKVDQYGLPTLGGEAAQLWAQVFDMDRADGFTGSGTLAPHNCNTAEDLIYTAMELGMDKPANVAQDALPMGDDTPRSDPAKASSGAEEPKPEAKPKEPQIKVLTGADKYKGLTKPKLLAALLERDAELVAATLGAHVQGTAPVATAAPEQGIRLYVDAIPNTDFVSLDHYIDALQLVLSKSQGTTDIRVAAKGSAIAYGQWKGAIAALARERLPEPGVYMVQARNREIVEIVVDALRPECSVFVRGI